jgi:hypothetical protein
LQASRAAGPTESAVTTDSTAPAAAVGEHAPLTVVFDRLRSVAQKENRGLFSILDEGQLLERSEGLLRIALAPGFGARRLATRIADLEAIAGRLFGHPTRVEIETGGGDETPRAARKSGRPPADSDLARRRRQDALQHPGINDAIDLLGGEIVDIRPIS